MLEHRQRGETDSDVDTDQRVPDDPRLISDDGTVASDADLIWGPQSSVPTPTSTHETVTAEAVPARRRFTWGRMLILVAGVASLVFGVGAVVLAGLAGSVTEPVVDVFGFDHTPLLGLIEIAAGVVLVLAALVPGGRWVAGPVGVAAIVGGALILAELEWTQTELAAERRFGWVPIVIGATAYLGAMAAPQRRGRGGT